MAAIVLLVALFIVGLVVGSFLNVVILRGARGESVRGRSRCEACGKTLGVWELIPVLSFIIQKARCRSCGAALLVQYPLVELGTAVAFLLVAWYFIGTFSGYLELLAAIIAVSAGIVILVSDLYWQIIPNGAVIVLALVGIAVSVGRETLAVDLVASLAGALFFASLWFVSRGRWMGLGDAKLAFATSLLIGFPASLSALLFAFWLGGIAGILLLALGSQTLKSRIPFGPFILAGTLLAFFFSGTFLSFTGLDLLL